MRILIFTNAYKPLVSGVVTSISLFRYGLIRAGHDVHIIAPEHESHQDDEPYVFRFPSLDLPEKLNLSLVLPFKTTMAPTVRGIKPAVIHSQHPFVMGGLAAAFARDLGLPLVFTFHTRYDVYAQRYVPIAPKLAGMVTDEIVRRYLEKCTHVIAPTPSVRDFILREYRPEVPVTVIPTPVCLEQYADLQPQRIRAQLRLQQAEMLLYVGRLTGEKNLDFLLRAFADIAARRPRARLVLVGTGIHERNLKRLARKLGLKRKVIFVGAVPHQDVRHYAAAADLFVFTSLSDTQGLVLTESLAAGTPVVAVRAPGPLDVLADGGGVLVSEDEEEFAQAVVNLLGDRARLRAMREEARRVAQRYSIHATVEQLLTVYEQAISDAARHGWRPLREQQRISGDTWREIVAQIRALGENLSTSFRTAWDDEESRWYLQGYLQEVRASLEETIGEIDRVIQEGRRSN